MIRAVPARLWEAITLPVRILTIGCVLVASAQAQTGTNSAPSLRMDLKGLQAMHEARLGFEHSRKVPAAAHGIYTDFHAVFVPIDEELEKMSQDQLAALARKTGIQIVFLSVPASSRAAKWHGLHNEVLFIMGTEASDNSMRFADAGLNGCGLQFLHRMEQHSDWTNKMLTGLEICNTSAGAKLDQTGASASEKKIREKLLTNVRAFPDEFFAGPPVYTKEIFAKWDQELDERALTGIGVNEQHSMPLFQQAAIDTHEVSFRNLVTHILAQEMTETSLRDALTNGHVFVAHDWLCNPDGFVFGAMNNLGVFGMGDTAPMVGTTRLTGITPLPAKLRLICKGTVVQETTGTNLTFQAKEPGAYRLEAWLSLVGEDRPWIFSNPVYLKRPSAAESRLPSAALSEDVVATKNLVYAEGAEEDSGKHKLDIYNRKGDTNVPVLFFIHGGSWKSGDRSLYGALGNRYARAGFVTVIPSYRLAPKHPHPAQIEDVAAAFAWTVKHISEYGGDTNRIYVAGHSAGGHLAALLTLDESYLATYQLSPKLIHGVLALSGVYNLTLGESQESVFGRDPEVRRKASPLFHVKPDAPPFLVTFCQWDYLSLPLQARQFHRALQKAGVKSELVFIPRQSHISEIVNVGRDDDPTVMAALKFMK